METILSIISLIFAIASIVITVYTFGWTAKRDRKQATLEAYNRLQNEVFDKLNLYTPSEIADICEDTKSDAYKEISGLVARIEHFCVGVNTKIYDEKVFYSLAHGYFDGHQLRKRIKPLIYKKNESSNRPNEIFYNDTMAVLKWMDKKAAKK